MIESGDMMKSVRRETANDIRNDAPLKRGGTKKMGKRGHGHGIAETKTNVPLMLLLATQYAVVN